MRVSAIGRAPIGDYRMTPPEIPWLSKSRFLAGLECPLRLWYQCYNRELATEPSPAQQAVFDSGQEVGILATQRFPGGILIAEDYLHHPSAVRSTKKAMQDQSVEAIFEAAFLEDDVRIRVDVIERLPAGRWAIHEVKSSTRVKDVYLPDVAIQYHVLRKTGLDVDRVFLTHINNEYVYDGQGLDHDALFTSVDLTGETIALQDRTVSQLTAQKDMLAAQDPPVISPSRHCKKPYLCEFWEHCTKDVPENWILNLSGITQKKLDDLGARGIVEIADIPDSFPLSALQERIRACVRDNHEFISDELAAELTDVEYPVHFLDFETVSPAISRYAQTRPYETIPFQWSDHILNADGSVDHREYLHDEDSDPREPFARTLIEALGEGGTIFIYTSYERTILNRLAEQFPQYHPTLMGITSRFKDLHAIVRKHYYHPAFNGSFSIKSVLPVLVPDMGYAGLAIQEGGQASVEYLRILRLDTPEDERSQIRSDLLQYCEQDTLAMLRVRDALIGRCAH